MPDSPKSADNLADKLAELHLIKNLVEIGDLEIKLHDQHIKAVKSRDKRDQLRVERLIKDNRDRFAVLAGEAWQFADDLQKELGQW